VLGGGIRPVTGQDQKGGRAMGPYCRYCEHRCFVLRCLPDTGRQLLMATCPAGEDHDQIMTGYTYETATTTPAVGGSRL